MILQTASAEEILRWLFTRHISGIADNYNYMSDTQYKFLKSRFGINPKQDEQASFVCLSCWQHFPGNTKSNQHRRCDACYESYVRSEQFIVDQEEKGVPFSVAHANQGVEIAELKKSTEPITYQGLYSTFTSISPDSNNHWCYDAVAKTCEQIREQLDKQPKKEETWRDRESLL